MRHHATVLLHALLSLGTLLGGAGAASGQSLPGQHPEIAGRARPSAADLALVGRDPALELTSPAAYPYVGFALQVRVTSLLAGRVDPNDVLITNLPQSGCYVRKVKGVSYGKASADSRGVVTFSVQAALEHASREYCPLRITVRPERADGTRLPSLFFQDSIRVLQPNTVVVTDTWGLRGKLGFTRAGTAIGSCDGTSTGPENYPVGMRERGGDISFTIRSGPIGTSCTWVSDLWVLPEGVRILGMSWRLDRSEKCKLNTEPLPVHYHLDRGFAPHVLTSTSSQGIHFPGSITSFHATVERDAEKGGVVYPTLLPGRPTWLLEPLSVALSCDITGWNDHGVRLVLESVTYQAPPGAVLP